MYNRGALILCLFCSLLVKSTFAQNLKNANKLYEYTDETYPIEYLAKGNSESLSITLDTPIKFYSETYETLFINTNGILTFNTEFTEFINQPFPLEYPAIAPFYSNVDTSGSNISTSISIFQSQAVEELDRATNLVRYGYTEESQFEARKLIVATWANVGYFNAKQDKLNIYQAVIVIGDDSTFVQFIYPSEGLKWLQAETGEFGLPDIRAQAGFVAEDGRYFILDGSGTENVRLLTENSNIGAPGVWLFRLSGLDYTENVREPFLGAMNTEATVNLLTCAESHNRYCHSHADCFDKREGFCCVCRSGYYGNGKACIKNDYPMRVTGSLTGQINGKPVDEAAKLQSYIVMDDARSYTAVHPVDADSGARLRLALPIFSTVSWLFAKSDSHFLNGYQLTGGEFTHTSKLHFDSGEILHINQTYEGLNYWDQLSVNIALHGQVPVVNPSAKFHMADYVDEYRFVSPSELHSVHSHVVEIPEENRVIKIQLEQFIKFQRCLLDEDVDPTGTDVLQKVSKIALDFSERDNALRTSALAKIGVIAENNACLEGNAVCGANTVCVPYEDTYRCDCLNGYSLQRDENEEEVCLDIDECAAGSHLCDSNAECINNEGGFTCICRDGFEGNGYTCLNGFDGLENADNYESTTYANNEEERTEPENENEERPAVDTSNWDICSRCSPDADCRDGRCQCHDGFSGDGYACNYICGHDEEWEEDRCVPILQEVAPICTFTGECTCQEGFELEGRICRYVMHVGSDAKPEDIVPCDSDFNCHINATCEWNDHELQHVCSCNRGFTGNGYNCDPIDDSCAQRPEICDPHAVCNYVDSLGKSACQCGRGYEGDGMHCQLAPECLEDVHCGENALCASGVCQCVEGHERDVSDKCVPAGRCGPVFCGANALCKWDAEQSVPYCDCINGYEGDALEGCKSKPVPCNVRNNCGVHANCEPTEDPAIYECQCIAGFHGDGFVCVEKQNCLNTPQLCDMNAKCMSTNTGLVCVCNTGFYGNGSACFERQQVDTGFLLVSQGVVIARVPLNGKNVQPISVTSMAIGLDKDCIEGRIYWGDISTKKIVSSKYDGTDTKAFITEDIQSPEGIAVDANARRIYWTDSVKDTIEVASLDDPTLRTIIVSKNLVNPRGIAIDAYREKIYWSDWNRQSPKIEMADLDGTAREVLLDSENVKLPNSLVVLDGSGELCYADAGTKKIECIDSYTKQRRTISNELDYPFGLAFTHNQFYWTDWNTKKLESIDAFGKRLNGLQTPFFGSHKMYGMTAIEDNCAQFSSPCLINNGGCMDGRICLANRKAPSGKSCKCTSLSKTCNIPQHGIPL